MTEAFEVTIRDSEGCIRYTYRDFADSYEEALDRAYEECREDDWAQVEQVQVETK